MGAPANILPTEELFGTSKKHCRMLEWHPRHRQVASLYASSTVGKVRQRERPGVLAKDTLASNTQQNEGSQSSVSSLISNTNATYTLYRYDCTIPTRGWLEASQNHHEVHLADCDKTSRCSVFVTWGSADSVPSCLSFGTLRQPYSLKSMGTRFSAFPPPLDRRRDYTTNKHGN